jgi:penicillin-binding protein 2
VRGEQDVVSALANGCDTFFYIAGGGDPEGRTPGLGGERLASYARAFGLGEEAGTGLDGEEPGFVGSPEWLKGASGQDWYKGDSYTMGVGREYVRVTPLQLASAFAAIANGGTLYRPQLVLRAVDSAGEFVQTFEPVEIRRVGISPENLALVREGLRASLQAGLTRNGVAYQGLARNVEVPGLDLAGVAATVDYLGPQGERLTHGWFAGFGPSNDPRVAVAVFVENGRGAEDAGELAKAILNHYLTRRPA